MYYNKMKIIFLIDSFRIGGKERRLLELLRFLDEQNNFYSKVVIFKNQIEYSQVKELKKSELIVLHRKFKKDPFVFFRLKKIVKKFNPDIIHSWGSMTSVYSSALSIFINAPLINGMIVKGNCKLFSKDWIRSRITFPFSSVILGNSYAGIKSYKAPIKKSRVIYNGFDFNRITAQNDNESLRKKIGVKTQFVVAMIAAIQPRKDYITYLNTAKKIVGEHDNITFLVVGEGESRKELMESYKNENIIFTGNFEDVENLIKIIDIGVLLTNPHLHLEGISNSILEMMAIGKPVIASAGGGTNEIICDEDNGILIPALSEEHLYKNIISLVNDKNKRKYLGKNAIKTVKEKFSIEKMCFDIINLYKEMINDNS